MTWFAPKQHAGTNVATNSSMRAFSCCTSLLWTRHRGQPGILNVQNISESNLIASYRSLNKCRITMSKKATSWRENRGAGLPNSAEKVRYSREVFFYKFVSSVKRSASASRKSNFARIVEQEVQTHFLSCALASLFNREQVWGDGFDRTLYIHA